MVLYYPGIYFSLNDYFDYDSEEFNKEKEDLISIKALYVLHKEKKLVMMLNEITSQHPEINIYAVLMNNEYIATDILEDHIDELSCYSKSQLKEFANFCKLKTTGNKNNLIDRLTDYFIETLEIYDYFITAYGLDVLTTNLYIANTIDLFEHYIHSELIELTSETDSSSSIEVLEMFYNKHFIHAKKLKDVKYYMYTLNKLSEFYNFEERYEDAFKIELEYFIIMINPLLISKEDIEIYDTYDEGNIKRLLYLTTIKGMDFSSFDEIWNNVVVDENKLNMSYDESVKILDKLSNILGFVTEIEEITNEILAKSCPIKK